MNHNTIIHLHSAVFFHKLSCCLCIHPLSLFSFVFFLSLCLWTYHLFIILIFYALKAFPCHPSMTYPSHYNLNFTNVSCSASIFRSSLVKTVINILVFGYDRHIYVHVVIDYVCCFSCREQFRH